MGRIDELCSSKLHLAHERMTACRDSDDWTDDHQAIDGEEGGDAGFPRAPATFSGSSAEAAATLAARADAIADKADDMRGRRPPIMPIAVPASSARPASPAEYPPAEGLNNIEAVQPSVQPEPVEIEPVGMPKPVAVKPAEMPTPQPIKEKAAELPAPKPVKQAAAAPPAPQPVKIADEALPALQPVKKADEALPAPQQAAAALPVPQPVKEAAAALPPPPGASPPKPASASAGDLHT